MLESIDRYERHHRPVRPVVPLDTFLEMLVQEWERYRLHLMDTLGAAVYNMSGVWRESHRYSDGRCALLAWAQLPHYQLHFVQQYRKTTGGEGALTVEGFEQYVTKLHGELKDADAFFDNRVGFFVPSLTPFVDSLKAEGLPFLRAVEARRQAIFGFLRKPASR